jgi:sugar diacid utilization regulator
VDDRDRLIRTLREQLSSMSSVFALSMALFDRTDEQEILALAIGSVAALGPFRAEGAYLVRDGLIHDGQGSATTADPSLRDRLADLAGSDGPIAAAEAGWSWAFPLRAVGGYAGYLVVSAAAEPSAHQQYLLRTVAQQTGAALNSSMLHRAERETAAELRHRGEQLTTAVSDLEQRGRIHELFTDTVASGAGEAGVAAALHELTGLAVAVEDAFGNLRAWNGPDRPASPPHLSARARAELLTEARRAGHPMRHGDRVLALAQPRDEVLGVLALVDPDHRAGPLDMFALEHGALVLAMALSHLRSLAEAELRLRRDLVDDLLSGTDDESARLRSTALGHDLDRPHQAVVVEWTGKVAEEALARAVSQAATRVLETGSLFARRAGAMVMIAPWPDTWGERHRWDALYRSVASTLRSDAGSIGVGRSCTRPSELPRSYTEAVHALRIRQSSAAPGGVTTFDQLGIYRLLAADDGGEVDLFVREWLGPLLDYDAANRSDLVTTLWQYYECGGNYDATAAALTIHRSTLRYRLRRIRELTGHDLRTVDNRLNLHVATRAWQVQRGSS